MNEMRRVESRQDKLGSNLASNDSQSCLLSHIFPDKSSKLLVCVGSLCFVLFQQLFVFEFGTLS